MNKSNLLSYFLAGITLFIAGWLAGGDIYYSPRLDAARLAADTANAKMSVHKASADACAIAIDDQSAALSELRSQLAASRSDASLARKAAAEARAKLDGEASEILAERVPPQADVCKGARDAFDAELRRERGAS